MADYTFNGFATTDLINQSGGAITTGSFVNLDSLWDLSVDALNFAITDDDTRFEASDTQSGTITDAASNPVAAGNITLGEAYVLSSGAQTLTLYEVLVDGAPAGYVADGYVFPGITYEVVGSYVVDPFTAPDYSAIQQQLYDPDDANFPPGGNFDDVLYTGAGDDIVGAGAGDDTVYAGDGADQLSGGAGTDTLYGEGGDDAFFIFGGDEVTNIDGGAGFDTVIFDTASASWGVSITFSTATGGSYVYNAGGVANGTFEGFEDFYLTDYDDWFLGGAASSPLFVTAGAGADHIETGTGDDYIVGGDGADTIYSGAGADFIDGGAGDDIIYYGAGGATQTDGDVVFGGAGNDVIDDVSGSYYTYNNALYGGGGDDTIRGGAGDDTIDGGDGQDLIYGEAGNDILTGGADEDIFYFSAGWGADTVHGSSTVTTGTDYDTLDFSALTTPVTATFTSSEAGTATDGTNTVTFDDIEGVVGGSGDDTFDASANDFDVLLDGGGGADVLTGGSANDILIGGTGDDTITTGAGYDTITFSSGDGHDTITDFDIGDDDLDGLTNDQFDVSGLTDSFGDPINVWDVTVTDNGSGSAVLNFPNGESITLLGIAPAQLSTAADLTAMGIPCFVSGTRIMTPTGERLVEDLREGDLVATARDGPQPVLWHGQRAVGRQEFAVAPHLRPVLIRDGALGNRGDLLVSPQHAMAVDGAPFGAARPVLMRARQLAAHGDGRIRVARGKYAVVYHHLLLPRHALVLANGIPSESLYPGRCALAGFDRAALGELFSLFPALSAILKAPTPTFSTRLYGPRALPVVSGRQLRAARFETAQLALAAL